MRKFTFLKRLLIFLHSFNEIANLLLFSKDNIVRDCRLRFYIYCGFIYFRDLSKKFANTSFILDTYDSTSASTFNFANLAILLQSDERATQLRKLIIDKEPPTSQRTLPKSFYEKSKTILKNMNSMQQRAIIKAIAANDYLLIKGMPGTGKTATIVSLVLLLVKVNYTVLITSHTHSAVDNVCLRLLECGIKLLRLGAENRIHPDLKKFSEHYLTKNCKTPEELDEVYNRPVS